MRFPQIFGTFHYFIILVAKGNNDRWLVNAIINQPQNIYQKISNNSMMHSNLVLYTSNNYPLFQVPCKGSIEIYTMLLFGEPYFRFDLSLNQQHYITILIFIISKNYINKYTYASIFIKNLLFYYLLKRSKHMIFSLLFKKFNGFKTASKLKKTFSINNKTKSLMTNRYYFSTENSQIFIFNTNTQPELLKLQLQYRAQQNASVFQDSIKSSTGFLEQMNIFKIFKVLESSPFNLTSYQQFFDIIQKNLKRKSDNMLMLMATVKQRISRHYKSENKVQIALQNLQQALDILQRSLVPPLFSYYSIYRQYGLIYYQIGEYQKAKQILTQTVDILQDFVSHSDDNVSTNDYCKKQARAYNALARIDQANRNKWINKANDMWQKYTDNQYNEIDYAQTVAQNVKKQLKQDIQKGEAYYHFNVYKFQKKELKEIIKKAKQEANKQKQK